jgi:CheY-like chemotaxis protein/anti-sigma regulatory factor (Ser/Thr protein kinase)
MQYQDATILLVDDEESNIKLLQGDLEDAGYKNFLIARNGEEALEILGEKGDEIDVVLLDRMMPGISGMEVLAEIKKDEKLERIPVIFQTAAASKDQVLEGIKAGAYYYLTKPYEEDTLVTIVAGALKDYNDYKKLRHDVEKFKPKLRLIKDSNFIVRTMDDVNYLSTFLAGYFPDPESVVLGISEILINAIEHGNLGLTYNEKKELMSKGQLSEEITRREALPENQEKYATVSYFNDFDNKEIRLTVKDQGDGFEWDRFLEIDPERATDPNGRGIAIARSISFDTVEYLGNGNEVCCSVKVENYQ